MWAFQTAALSDIPTIKPSTIKEKDPLPGAASPVKQHHLVQGRKNRQEKQWDLPFITHPLHHRKICLIWHRKEVKEKYKQMCPFCHPPTQLPTTRSSNATTKETCSTSAPGWGGRWGPDQELPGTTKCWRVPVLEAQANRYRYCWLQLEMIKNDRKWLDKKKYMQDFLTQWLPLLKSYLDALNLALKCWGSIDPLSNAHTGTHSTCNGLAASSTH